MTPREAIRVLEERMNASVLGQEHIVSRLIMGLLADGNILIEGLPGLAKTRAVRSMAEAIEGKFSRIQFTPDLLPSDVIGTQLLQEEDGKQIFHFHPGPIFGNIILADEINRAPAKIQSAMLEAMEERQVTVAGKTYKLPKLFNVMATQNPLEQEGTYPLSEAQKDRFFMHVKIDYAKTEAEFEMIRMIQGERFEEKKPQEKIPQEMIFAARREVAQVKFSDALGHYIVELVFATRYPLRYSKQLEVMIDVGVSPRATLALTQCAQANAWMQGRDEVTVQDVRAVIKDVFHHRLVISEHALQNKRTAEGIIDLILEQVPVPKI
ncbi:MAG TPA: MoxR family ATPase [Sulfurovum sp.]|uniref:AAA family ATPase n=1 Tax=Sulfurovum sp. TaxID=1969726 RepID=UPI002F942875